MKINFGKVITFLKKASAILEYLTKKKPLPDEKANG